MRDTTRTGTITEMLVATKLMQLGFDVYTPLVDSGVDMLVLSDDTPIRIQVKTAHFSEQSNAYIARSQRGSSHATRVHITEEHCDFLIVSTPDVYYVIPASELGIQNVLLYPHRTPKRSRFEDYKEAWYLLSVPG